VEAGIVDDCDLGTTAQVFGGRPRRGFFALLLGRSPTRRFIGWSLSSRCRSGTGPGRADASITFPPDRLDQAAPPDGRRLPRFRVPASTSSRCPRRGDASADRPLVTGSANVLVRQRHDSRHPPSDRARPLRLFGYLRGRGLLRRLRSESRVAGVTASHPGAESRLLDEGAIPTPRRGSSSCTMLIEPPYMLRSTTHVVALSSPSASNRFCVSPPMPSSSYYTVFLSRPSILLYHPLPFLSTWFGGFPLRV